MSFKKFYLKNLKTSLSLLKEKFPEYSFQLDYYDNINSFLISNDSAKMNLYFYDDDSKNFYISNLKVNEKNRKKGIGNKFLKLAENIVKLFNGNSLSLWVKENFWLHDWYEKNGYKDSKKHSEKNHIWMVKDIGN